MYSSLDRIDMEVDGNVLVQTDHRGRDEIEEDEPLSTLFALIRVLNAKRHADAGPDPSVNYLCQVEPPEFLRRAVAVAGGTMIVGLDAGLELAAKPTQYPAVLELLNKACSDIANLVASTYKLELSTDGLKTLQSKLAREVEPAKEDEIAYWTCVVRLGSFAGEVLRRMAHGEVRWIVAELGTLPVAVQVGKKDIKANPLGKAIKFFENGEEDDLVFFVQAVQALENGPAQIAPPKRPWWKFW